MNTLDIERAMRSRTQTGAAFGGVFAANRLPIEIHVRPSFVVVNFDEDNLPGSHWACFFLPAHPRGVEFFCSMGQAPTHPRFAAFAARNGGITLWNAHQLQSEESDVCGEYVCTYALHRSLGQCLPSFTRLFGNNRKVNDKFVLELFNLNFTCTTHFRRGTLRDYHVQSCLPTCHVRGRGCPAWS